MRFPIVIFLLISSLLFPIPLAIPTTKSDKTITLDLIHKASFLSHTQYYDRLTNSLQRSIHRVNRLINSSSGSSYINHAIMLHPGDGDYLMKISIGTPSVDIYAALETRSDLIWTQCKSCIVCFNQNGPYYDPSNSSTYAPLSCDSSLCYPSVQDAGSTFSSLATACSNGSCFYFQREGSFLTDGILATDHVTLGDIVTLPNATFGCGMFNAYNGVDDVNRNTSVVVSGSVGLGPGPTSIVSTVYEYSLSTSFAYCLSPPFVNSGTSKIGFGVDYEDGCNGTKSTSMWFSAPYSDYRFVLSAISIGDEMVVFSQGKHVIKL
ncbi:Aspartic proteinase nepenthesin-1 [Linum grandiflorum]